MLFRLKNKKYDDTGNILKQEYRHINYGWQTMDYEYDNLYRLSRFNYTGYHPPEERFYTYDDNGNFEQMGNKTFSTTQSFTNKFKPNGFNYTYDTIGRIDHINGKDIEYDFLSNMIIHGNDSYRYNAENQRIVKTEYGETTYYIKKGLETLAEYDGNGDLKEEYIYGVDGLVAMHDVHEGFHWYYKDHLGSTRHLNDNTQQRDYFPFGEAIFIAGSKTNYLFTGKELDNSTGLYYFGARYYDPSIGRWLVPDPAGQYFSPYVYAANNPLVNIDKDGEFAFGIQFRKGNSSTLVMFDFNRFTFSIRSEKFI